MNDSTTGSLVRRKQRCGNCKWFDGENGTGDQSDKGPCRRHPPPVIDRVLPMLLPSSKSTESRFDPIIRVDDQAVYAVRAMDTLTLSSDSRGSAATTGAASGRQRPTMTGRITRPYGLTDSSISESSCPPFLSLST